MKMGTPKIGIKREKIYHLGNFNFVMILLVGMTRRQMEKAVIPIIMT